MDRSTGYEDEDYLTDTCCQCGDLIAVRLDEERPLGSFYCDDCVRRTTNRAARFSPLTNHLFETAAVLAKVNR